MAKKKKQPKNFFDVQREFWRKQRLMFQAFKEAVKIKSRATPKSSSDT